MTKKLGIRSFDKGLVELADGAWAYLQPDGSWGWSNAGLIVDGEDSLLVDTLFDGKLTAAMLKEMKNTAGFGADDIATLVNTHANGDHTYGNELVVNAEIIASTACAEEMSDFPPAMLSELMRQAPDMGDTGAFLLEIFGAFDFEGLTLKVPTRTFEEELTLKVGDKPPVSG